MTLFISSGNGRDPLPEIWQSKAHWIEPNEKNYCKKTSKDQISWMSFAIHGSVPLQTVHHGVTLNVYIYTLLGGPCDHKGDDLRDRVASQTPVSFSIGGRIRSISSVQTGSAYTRR